MSDHSQASICDKVVGIASKHDCSVLFSPVQSDSIVESDAALLWKVTSYLVAHGSFLTFSLPRNSQWYTTVLPWSRVEAMFVLQVGNLLPEDLRPALNGVCHTVLSHAQHRLGTLGFSQDTVAGTQMAFFVDRAKHICESFCGKVEFVALEGWIAAGFVSDAAVEWTTLRKIMQIMATLDSVNSLVVAIGPSLKAHAPLTIWDGNHRCDHADSRLQF